MISYLNCKAHNLVPIRFSLQDPSSKLFLKKIIPPGYSSHDFYSKTSRNLMGFSLIFSKMAKWLILSKTLKRWNWRKKKRRYAFPSYSSDINLINWDFYLLDLISTTHFNRKMEKLKFSTFSFHLSNLTPNMH